MSFKFLRGNVSTGFTFLGTIECQHDNRYRLMTYMHIDSGVIVSGEMIDSTHPMWDRLII